MKKVCLLLTMLLLLALGANAQTKMDGTPDMRYKANKQAYPTQHYAMPRTNQPRNYNNGGEFKLKNGYVKSNGTYVEPHFQTSPNDTKLDNFSTQGNINPFTGKEGKVDPLYTPPARWRTVNPYGTIAEPNEKLQQGQVDYTPTPIYSPSLSTTSSQCLGITQKGAQCKRMTKDASGYCYQHP